LGAPNPNFALKLWETGSSIGENFGCPWKIFKGTSMILPSKYEKDQIRNGGEIRGQIWGSKFLITPTIKCMGKMLEAF